MRENYETERGLHALNVSIIFTTIATVLVIARLYTRIALVKNHGLDDLAILNAAIFDWGFFVTFVYEVKYGAGEHMANLPQNIIEKQLMFLWASIPLYQMTLFSTKISILLQYRRLFAIRQMRIACNILLGLISLYAAWTFVSAWLNCVPVAKFWDSDLDGYCLDREALWFSNSAMHIASDLVILFLPIPVIKTLQLPRRQRIALMMVFALGGFVVVTTIIRLHSLMIIAKSSDPTYDNVGAATWSAIECNVAVICACLPALKPLISKYLPRVVGSRGTASNTNNRYYTHGYGKRLPGHSYIPHASFAGVGGRHDDEEDHHALKMPNIDHCTTTVRGLGSSENSQEDLNGASVKDKGIKVTTLIHQESVQDFESSSLKGLVTQER